jgi:hypothetical protein
MSHCTVVSVIKAFSGLPTLQNAGDYTGKPTQKAAHGKKEYAVQTIGEIHRSSSPDKSGLIGALLQPDRQ